MNQGRVKIGGLAAEGRAYGGGRVRAPGGCATTPACAAWAGRRPSRRALTRLAPGRERRLHSPVEEPFCASAASCAAALFTACGADGDATLPAPSA